MGGSGFAIASAPFVSSAASSVLLAWVYVISACFFTSAAFLQVVGSPWLTVAWWAAAIQQVGTILFNVNTIRGLGEAQGRVQDVLLVWRPEAFGSICFLVSSVLAFAALDDSGRRVWTLQRSDVDLRATWWNMAGSVLFGISAVTGYVTPGTDVPLNAAWMNATTMLGALCFVRAAWIVLPSSEADPCSNP